MEIYGLIGYPLEHSFSSKFFNLKFQREGIHAEYLNFEIEEVREVRRVVLTNPNLKGLNVTIPHKEAILSFLDEVTPEVKAIGAVNAIRVDRLPNDLHDYRLVGHNTDYIGFKESIAPLINPIKHRNALILGTGGASKAVTCALTDMGIGWKLVSRNPAKKQLGYDELSPEVLKRYTAIINATPVGTFPNVEQCPPIPYNFLTPEHLLYDLVYNPKETLFLKKGKERGTSVKNGEEMLERQALAAWDFWNG
ncbi:MAG: shikimate dehydrogenase [Bacteroidota bacterium]|jgi:shikimate dehydrogenase|nr:shikimate dehydrogenase [Bacteroidota bacterium]HHU96727.1 shikimate dehydrogenase [Petrimonas sp.]